MRRIVLILFALLTFAACSTRVDYERSTAQPAPETININTAALDELERLPHIGRKTAEAIVQFRMENGPYARIEHLMLIRGLSERRFLELRPFLRVR